MNKIKLVLNIFLAIVMLLLMDPRSFYGLLFHEWAGLIIGLFFLIHTVLNWAWIKKVTVCFFRSSPRRARLNYLLDVLLIAGMILMILSGIAIARTINLPCSLLSPFILIRYFVNSAEKEKIHPVNYISNS